MPPARRPEQRRPQSDNGPADLSRQLAQRRERVESHDFFSQSTSLRRVRLRLHQARWAIARPAEPGVLFFSCPCDRRSGADQRGQGDRECSRFCFLLRSGIQQSINPSDLFVRRPPHSPEFKEGNARIDTIPAQASCSQKKAHRRHLLLCFLSEPSYIIWPEGTLVIIGVAHSSQ